MLIECCFVDDKDDAQLYDSQKMAEAIVYGITGMQVIWPTESKGDPDAAASGAETVIGSKKEIYRVQVGAYTVKENADAMKKKIKDSGFDAIIVKA